jgi:hypothetical protein
MLGQPGRQPGPRGLSAAPGSVTAMGAAERDAGPPRPLLPDYAGASLPNLVAALSGPPGGRPDWLPGPVAEARQVVLLVVDGLGWLQLRARPACAPTLSAMTGGPITSVVPTTTATALASITLGCAPAVHGMVGYRLRVTGPGGDPEILNTLRWTTASGDARPTVAAPGFLTGRPFAGR